jgi:hypothetical protein
MHPLSLSFGHREPGSDNTTATILRAEVLVGGSGSLLNGWEALSPSRAVAARPAGRAPAGLWRLRRRVEHRQKVRRRPPQAIGSQRIAAAPEASVQVSAEGLEQSKRTSRYDHSGRLLTGASAPIDVGAAGST